jgi:hypothetical protein
MCVGYASPSLGGHRRDRFCAPSAKRGEDSTQWRCLYVMDQDSATGLGDRRGDLRRPRRRVGPVPVGRVGRIPCRRKESGNGRVPCHPASG